MFKKLSILFAFCGSFSQIQAQTVADFETALPSADTSFLETFGTDGNYPFSSGNFQFEGAIAYSGTYLTGFNYSNRTDTVTGDWTNMWSAKTGTGYQSSNYLIAYLESNFANSNETMVYGVGIKDSSANQYLYGTYITNTMYAYTWIKENYSAGEKFELIIKGYNNGTFTNDSMIVTMASVTTQDTFLIKDWTWLDLSPLKAIDSFTVQMKSNNPMTPYYFAMDNLTSSDGVCPTIDQLAIENITNNEATITWEQLNTAYITNANIAIDSLDTNEPAANTQITNWTGASSYTFTNLEAGKEYVAHIQLNCANSETEWQKVKFTTTGLSIRKSAIEFASIYPNPANNIINIKATQAIESFTIYNVNGQKMQTGAATAQIDIAHLLPGMYMIQLSSKTGATQQVLFSKL